MARACILALTFLALLVMHLSLSWLISQGAELFDIDENTRRLLSQAVLVFVVVVSMAAVVMSVVDVVKLVWYEIFGGDSEIEGGNDEQAENEETQPPTC